MIDSTIVAGATASRHWRNTLAVLLVSVLLLIIFQWQLATDLASIYWRSKTFNHCLVIPLISGWLIWQRRQQVLAMTPQASAAGLLLLAAAAALLLLADLAGIAVAAHFALVLSVQALAWTLLGTNVCRQLLFPLLYLWFAVPFGEFLVPKLQDVTADMAVYLLRLFAIPVFRDGHFIALPNGDFLVEEACSGISYLIASLALGTLFSYLYYRSYWRRAGFIALSIVVPIVANGVRAFGIILTAHLTNNEYAVGVDHLIYGWVFFGFVMFLLFAVGRTFADGGPDTPVATGDPVTTAQRLPAAILVAALTLVIGPSLLTRQAAEHGQPHFAPTTLSAAWQRQTIDRIGVQLVGATETVMLSDGVLDVVIGYFPVDSRGQELINSNHRLYEKSRWRQLNADQRVIAGVKADGLRLDNGYDDVVLVHSLYVFPEAVQGLPWLAKWHQMQARIGRAPAPALYLMVARAATLDDQELNRRLANLLPALQQSLRARPEQANFEQPDPTP